MPAGNPDGGQWTGGGDAASSLVDELGEAVSRLPAILLAGGFDKEDMGKTVQEFVAEKCRGSIYSVLPSQFLEMTIADVLSLSKSGNRGADTCKKLLKRDEYRK